MLSVQLSPNLSLSPKRLLAGLAVVGSLLLGTGSALAAPVGTDQINYPPLNAPFVTVPWATGSSGLGFHQTFTPDWTGPLNGVWLAATCTGCSGSLHVVLAQVHAASIPGAYTTTMIGMGTVPASTWAPPNSGTLQYVDLHGARVQQGVTYALVVIPDSRISPFQYVVTTGNHYSRGELLTILPCGGLCLTAPQNPTTAGEDAVFLTQMGDSTRQVNDTDPNLQYSGINWGYYPGRPASFGDLQNDVHATLNNGDSVSYTFTGTGISYISEKSDGYGLVDVYLDGQFQQTLDANAAGVHNLGNQVLFSTTGLSSGQHTLTLVKKSGVYMLIDALVVNS